MENTKEKVESTLRSQLKENYIRALYQGGEIAYSEILNMINNGKDIDDIKSWCETYINSKKDMYKFLKVKNIKKKRKSKKENE